jgi:hypothetical protein
MSQNSRDACEESLMCLMSCMQGSTVGIYECVYNSHGDYSSLNPAKIFWLIFWSIQTSWVAMFPGYIAYALFGMLVHGIA